MTREQMIDEAVRWSMARTTMRCVLTYARNWEQVRILEGHPNAVWAGGSYWLKPDAPFFMFPRRLAAVRREFRRLSEAA